VLTLISDDNFSMIQRTLLLQFTLLECFLPLSPCGRGCPRYEVSRAGEGLHPIERS
jgi:hypothetical protein